MRARIAAFAVAALALAFLADAAFAQDTPTVSPTRTPTATPTSTRQTVTLNTVPCGAEPHAELTPSAIDDAADGKLLNSGGNVKLLVRNGSASPVGVTVLSVADSFSGRTGDIGPVTVGAGEITQFGPFRRNGWNQSDGYVWFNTDASDADLLFYGVKDSCP